MAAEEEHGRETEDTTSGRFDPPVGDPSGAPGTGRSGAGRGAEGEEEDVGSGRSSRGSGGAADPGEKDRRRPLGEGFRQGLGVLSAFKEALEETIHEARERGELSTDRAREVMQEAMQKAREAAGEARERLDFATQQEVDELRDVVEDLRVRMENLERRVPQDADVGPTRTATGSGTRDAGTQGGGSRSP